MHPAEASDAGRRLTAFSLILVAVTGCAARTSTFDIVDHRKPGEAQRYRETFDEAYYDVDEHGNVDIVLRRSTQGERRPDLTITQVIHMHSIWRSIPGRTVAHRTQLNGTVCYHIVVGRTGATFEGAGSLFFKQNRRGDTLTGSLDLARLRPKRALAAASPTFQRAELSGTFRARRDPRRVVRILHEMDRLFARGRLAPPDAAGGGR